jgi:hypothetical protein
MESANRLVKTAFPSMEYMLRLCNRESHNDGNDSTASLLAVGCQIYILCVMFERLRNASVA